MTAIAVYKKTLDTSNISCPKSFNGVKQNTCILSVTYRQLLSVSVPLVLKCQTCPNFSKNTPIFPLPLPETSSMEEA